MEQGIIGEPEGDLGITCRCGMNRADAALLVVRASKTRYSVVERLLEQLPRERLLGVVLNRTEPQTDDTAYYYQPRYQRSPEPVAEQEQDGEQEDVAHSDERPEMIYIEEDVLG